MTASTSILRGKSAILAAKSNCWAIGPVKPEQHKLHRPRRAMRNVPISQKRKRSAQTAKRSFGWFPLLVPDEFQTGAVVDAHGRRPSSSHAKNSPSYVRRTVVRPLVNARREIAHSGLLSQGQNPCALGAVLPEAQLNGSRRKRSAGQGKTEQVYSAVLTEGSGGIELAGIKSECQLLRVLAGEVRAGNCPDDLCNGDAAEVSGERESSVRQAGAGARRGVEIAGYAQAKAVIRIGGLVEGSKLAILVEFKHG